MRATVSLISVYLAGLVNAYASTQPSISMGITVAPTLTSGQPVQAVLVIENMTAEEIVVDLGPDRKGAFVFTVDGPNGVERSQFARTVGLMRTATVRVPARSSYKQQLVLNRILALNDVGRYHGAVEFTGEIRTPSGQIIDAAGTLPLEFAISPRSTEVLNETFRRLAELSATPDGEQLDAVDALTSVNDVTVVRHLNYVMSKTRVHDAALLHALARIGSDEAREILDAASVEIKTERAAIARDALSRMKR